MIAAAAINIKRLILWRTEVSLRGVILFNYLRGLLVYLCAIFVK
jgi:hypothetical protein